MGRDKALLEIEGQPMVQIAVQKLRNFCAEVSIAGNRDDLSSFAEVVREERVDSGPAAGIEAGLRAAREPWAMFIPVDVPLVPAEFLRRWCEEALRANMTVSFLAVSQYQPTFCLMRRDRAASFTHVLDEGERKLELLLNRTAAADDVASWIYEAYELYEYPGGPDERTLQRWFGNMNTPEEFAEVARQTKASDTD